MNYEERTSEAIRKIKAELLEQDLIDPNEGLTGLEIKQRKHLEKIVSKSLSASVAAAKALRVIHNHRDGAMWRKHHDSFQDYCRAKWGYQKAHAYRLLEAGEFIVDLEVARGRESDSQSPFGDSPAGGWYPRSEGQIRPLLKLPKAERPGCWIGLLESEGSSPEKITGVTVKRYVRDYSVTKGIPLKKSKRRVSMKLRAEKSLKAFSTIIEGHPESDRIGKYVSEIEALL